MSRIAPREPGTIALSPARSLVDLLWVANTRHGPGGHWFARPAPGDPDHDHLATPGAAVGYLADHGVGVPSGAPTPSDLADLAAIRDMVHGLVVPGSGWTTAVRKILDRSRFRLGLDGSVVAEATGWGAFVADLLPPLVELVRRRGRLASCGNPACRLLFLDASRNASRRWCDDGGCGNRDRVRRHRHGDREDRTWTTATTSG